MRTHGIGYLIALGATVVAVLVRHALSPWLPEDAPMLLLVAVLLVSSWYGGLRPGLLATGLCLLAGVLFFLEPIYSFAVAESNDRLRLVLFLGIGVIISILSELRFQAFHQAVEGQKRLEEEVRKRVHAEANERRQHEQLRITLASIGDAVIATDRQGRVTFLNGVAENLTGWTHEDAQGQPLEAVFNILHEQTRQPVENPVEKVLKEGVIVGLGNHTVLVARDGTERPIDDSAAPIRNPDGGLLGVVLVFRDVTEQRRAHNELRASEARKSAILETALDCIITMDHEGKVVEFNPAAEKSFGYRHAEVVGRPLADLIIPPSLRGRHQKGIAHYLATGEGPLIGQRMELPAMRADGSEFPVELAISRIPTEGPPLFTAYLRDIGERKRAERHRNVRLAVPHVLSQAANVQEAARGVLRAVGENLGWDVGFFWMADEQKQALVCRESWHRDEVPTTAFETASCNRTFQRGEGLPGHVWSTGQAAWILDVLKDNNFPRAASAAKDNLHSAFACPVVVGEQRLGVIEFFTNRIQEPDADLLEMMGTVSGIFGQFIERRQAEERLRRSERELADFFENATIGLHWVGPDGTILRANRAELELLGYAPEEYIGHNITEFHADEEVICDILRRLKAKEKLQDYPARMRCKDGSIRDVLIHSSVLFDEGRFVHTRCFTRDVTERKQIETELRDARSRLDAALEAGAIATWTWDIPNNRLFTDSSLARLFNLSPLEAEGGLLDRYIQSIHPDDWPNVSAALDQSLASGDDYEADYRIVQSDGSVRWVVARGRVEWDETGRPVRMPGVLVDITERKRLEEELRLRVEELADANRRKEELLALLDTLQRNAPVGFAFVDREFRYVRINEALAAIDGNVPEYHLGRTVEETVPKLWPELEPLYRRVLESEQPVLNQEVAGETPAAPGQARHWLVNYYPVFVQHEVAGIGILVTDITDRKRLEDELRQQAKRLADADRRKDEFLATLAHELRNPLAPIRTGLEVMKLAKDDPATVEEIRNTMQRQTQQLITLVDDLLDVSRITQGKLELRKCRVRLSDVIQSAVEASKPFVDEAGHGMAVAVPEQPIYLEADPNRLAQVLSNLLNNAVKYTPEGGDIRLTAEQQGSDVVISVKDTGIGIPADMLDRIFEMFAQIGRPLEKGYSGLGIGLTLVKTLTEMHGGRIEVHSEGDGRGSEFSVRLPIPLEMPVGETGPSQSKETATAVNKRRVLIVDDNEAAAKMLGMVVKMLGHEVRMASDGQQAVELASEFLPDMVLMDLGMPRMNGYEAARRIRQQSWGERMVLVALTGWGQEEDRRRTRESGFDHHLVKPADPAQLQRLLAETWRSAPNESGR